MKKICALILTALLLLGLAACAAAPSEPYTVDVSGQTFTVDPAGRTVTDGDGNAYTYVIDDGSVTITYPNGAEYWWSRSAGIGVSGFDADTSGYASGMTLENVLDDEVANSEPPNPGILFLAGFCVLLGVVNVLFPYAAWYLRHGWHYRDAEPSDGALIFIRVCGVAVIIFGIVILFV